MSHLAQDLRFALRQLRKSLGFTTVAVLTLGLGIGASTAVFTLVDTVLLRPLPFPQPGRIVALDTLTQPTLNPDPSTATIPSDTSYPNFFDWRDRARTFSSLASYATQSFTLGATGGAPAQRVDGMAVSSGFFTLLGTPPALGRDFLRSEESAGNRSVILSHALWTSALNGNPNPIGQTIHLSDDPFTVVGVLPSSFTFPNAPDAQAFITPGQAMEGKEPSGKVRGWNQLSVLGRLAPGVTLPQASAEMQHLQQSLAQQFPDDDGKAKAVSLLPMLQDVTGDVARPLHLLFAAVAFLLLIACANVAGLLLTRSAARRPELALRSALGATRPQIIRQLLLESLTLSTLGGLGGLLLAVTALHLAPTLLPNDLPRLNELSLNPHLFLFALAASLLTGLLFGVVPAWRASRLDPAVALRDSTRSTSAGRSQNRLHAALVIGETALGLVLLIAAGLFLRSFAKLLSTDPGFNPQHLITFRVGMPPKRFEDAQLLKLTQQLETRFSALPGVQQSTFAFPFPLAGGDMTVTFKIDGQPTAPGNEPVSRISAVPSNFFHALQIPLLRGRLFSSAEDQPNGPRTILVNQAFAQHFFPGQDPLGKHITPDMSATDKPESREIVGVVGNTTRTSLAESAAPEYILPFAQIPVGPPIFALRVAGDPAPYNTTVRTLVAQIDPTLPVYAVRTNLLTRSTAQGRFQTSLLSAFAALALLLSALGLYAVLSYMVGQRTLELGLRLALGAQRSDVLTLVLRRGLLLSAAGLALGLIASFALTRYLATLLFHTPALDPRHPHQHHRPTLHHLRPCERHPLLASFPPQPQRHPPPAINSPSKGPRPMIDLRNLERSYKTGHTETWVLRRVNLTINPGEFVTVMGPSGAGKSSLLNVLAMLDDAWRGEFFFEQTPVHTLSRKQRSDLARKRIGMVFQSYHLLDDLTVAENIDLPLSYKDIPRSERQALVADTLDKFNIVGKKDLFPSQLSGGQQQLVGIARAVIHKPSLLLADEPTGNLHSAQAAEIMELFRQLNHEGTTIVQVTHSETNASYGSRTLELRDGWLTRDTSNPNLDAPSKPNPSASTTTGTLA